MTLKATITKAAEKDVKQICDLTVALAVYERKKPEEILVTEENLRRWGFGETSRFEAFIAREGEIPVGLAVCYFGYSGYLGRVFLYIEDLFVLPEYRRQGIGTALLAHLGGLALEHDCVGMRWAVFDWNDEAISFYKSIGGQLRPDLIQTRLDSPELRKFVAANGHEAKSVQSI
jgi:GNAT superfamily N-acetyltransferase